MKTEESLAQVVVSQAEEGRFPGVTGNWLRGFITQIYKYDTIRCAAPVCATDQRRLRAREAERVGSELRVGDDVAQCSEADQRGDVQPDRRPQTQVQPRRQAAVLEDIDHCVVEERREGAKDELPDVVAEAECGRAYGCGEDVEADAHEDDGRPAQQASKCRAAEDDVGSPREQQPHRPCADEEHRHRDERHRPQRVQVDE